LSLRQEIKERMPASILLQACRQQSQLEPPWIRVQLLPSATGALALTFLHLGWASIQQVFPTQPPTSHIMKK
jgi:hypothetical protein